MRREVFRVCLDPRYSQGMDQSDRIATAIVAFLSVIIIGSLCGFAWFSAGQEAAAFNRLTDGPKVTTWDAVWLDLRVEAR